MAKKNNGKDFLFSDDCGFINGDDEGGESYRYSDGSGYFTDSSGSRTSYDADDDDEDDEENEDDVFYEVTCDACGQKLNVSEDVLLEGEIECPNCGELLEFDFSDIFDGEECDPADCEGCGSNCNSSEE